MKPTTRPGPCNKENHPNNVLDSLKVDERSPPSTLLDFPRKSEEVSEYKNFKTTYILKKTVRRTLDIGKKATT